MTRVASISTIPEKSWPTGNSGRIRPSSRAILLTILLPTFLCMVALVWLATANSQEFVSQPLLDYVRGIEGKNAYGCYFKKQKYGWCTEEFALGKHDGKQVAIYTYEAYSRFSAEDGTQAKILTEEMVTRFALTLLLSHRLCR